MALYGAVDRPNTWFDGFLSTCVFMFFSAVTGSLFCEWFRLVSEGVI